MVSEEILFDVLVDGEEVAYVWAKNIDHATKRVPKQWPKYKHIAFTVRASTTSEGLPISKGAV